MNRSYVDKDSEPKDVSEPIPAKKSYEFGDRGSSWRMMKLKRVFEIAAEEKKPVDEVAMERYDSQQAFQEALDERAFLDKAEGIKSKNSILASYKPIPAPKQFKKPEDTFQHPSSTSASSSKPASVPSIFTQQRTDNAPILSVDDLNSLYSKVLKARIMKSANLPQLEEQYEREKKRHLQGQSDTVIVPTVDERSKPYDLGGLSNESNLKKRRFEVDTHTATGERIRYSKDEEATSLSELVRQEKMGAGVGFDKEFADRIAKDASFRNDLDYMDEDADRLSRKKDVSDSKKRQFAINDFKKSQEAVDKCSFCYTESIAPRVSVISLGVKTYLALPETIDMVPLHCLIVPVQHTLSSLELEDDAWDEIRNFQKCLSQMAFAQNQGYIFMEQVINFKWRKHTVIECIPVPKDIHDDAPAYFKVLIVVKQREC